jgi:hypothetical protein
LGGKSLVPLEGMVQTKMLRYEDALPLIARQKLSEFIVDRRTNLVLTNLACGHEIARSALFVVHTKDLAEMESLNEQELANYLFCELNDYATRYLTESYGYFRSSRGPLYVGADYPLNFREKRIYSAYTVRKI